MNIWMVEWILIKVFCLTISEALPQDLGINIMQSSICIALEYSFCHLIPVTIVSGQNRKYSYFKQNEMRFHELESECRLFDTKSRETCLIYPIEGKAILKLCLLGFDNIPDYNGISYYIKVSIYLSIYHPSIYLPASTHRHTENCGKLSRAMLSVLSNDTWVEETHVTSGPKYSVLLLDSLAIT